MRILNSHFDSASTLTSFKLIILKIIPKSKEGELVLSHMQSTCLIGIRLECESKQTSQIVFGKMKFFFAKLTSMSRTGIFYFTGILSKRVVGEGNILIELCVCVCA